MSVPKSSPDLLLVFSAHSPEPRIAVAGLLIGPLSKCSPCLWLLETDQGPLRLRFRSLLVGPRSVEWFRALGFRPEPITKKEWEPVLQRLFTDLRTRKLPPT